MMYAKAVSLCLSWLWKAHAFSRGTTAWMQAAGHQKPVLWAMYQAIAGKARMEGCESGSSAVCMIPSPWPAHEGAGGLIGRMAGQAGFQPQAEAIGFGRWRIHGPIEGAAVPFLQYVLP
jgi:hypothetical protein